MSTEMVQVNSGVQAQAPAPIINPANASTAVAMSREMSEAVASVRMAKMFPRDKREARERILNECTRESLAERAVYEYTKGGQEVTGPSIRLAEMIAQNWCNMNSGVRELSQRNGESECEAYSWDMERNNRISKTFHVSHIRHTRKGDYAVTDPREIYEMVANSGARRLRACILANIPGDIVDEAVAACKETLAAKFEVTEDRIKALLEKFGEMGVSREMIERRIQCRIEALRPMQMVQLAGIYNSLKDGMSKKENWFEVDEQKTDAKSVPAATRTTSTEQLRARLGVKAAQEAAQKPVEASAE